MRPSLFFLKNHRPGDIYCNEEIILAGGKAFSLPTMIHGFSMFAL